MSNTSSVSGDMPQETQPQDNGIFTSKIHDDDDDGNGDDDDDGNGDDDDNGNGDDDDNNDDDDKNGKGLQ